MSTFENKVEVITEFLQSRARLGRFTTFSEVGFIAGKLLAQKGYRNTSQPVSREKVADVLAQIAKTSYADDGAILPAIVLHANDNGAGHRFTEWAQELEVFDPNSDSIMAVHVAQIRAVFAQYGGLTQLNAILTEDLPSVPGNIADLMAFNYSTNQPSAESESYEGDEAPF